jgi:hypothetical protein
MPEPLRIGFVAGESNRDHPGAARKKAVRRRTQDARRRVRGVGRGG